MRDARYVTKLSQYRVLHPQVYLTFPEDCMRVSNKSRLRFLLPVLLALMLAACGGGGGDGGTDGGPDTGGGSGGGGGDGSTSLLASIQISPETAVVGLGGEQAFYAFGKDSGGNILSDVSFSWSSGDTGIATVDVATGVVTGLTVGSTTLTASSGNVSETVNVRVVVPGEGMIAAGSSHACGLTRLGVAYCWGNNSSGQTGADTTDAKVMQPMPVQGGHLFVDVEAGVDHTCGLTSEGITYCWGSNYNGQLGYTGNLGEYNYTKVPVAVETEQRFVDISTEQYETCGLTASGEAWCWPYSADGGWSSNAYEYDTPGLPVRVETSLVFTQIDVGTLHACGVVASGAAYCWGQDNWGQLGTGAFVGSTAVPLAVTGGVSFQSVSAGVSHTCGLDQAGKAYCWGDYTNGRLGIGPDAGSTPGLNLRAPQPVLTSAFFTQLDAGGGHTMALDPTGVAWWWGGYEFMDDCSLDYIMNGGSCTTYSRTAETPVSVNEYGETFERVSAGGTFNMALNAEGESSAWWNNSNGQLGVGYASLFVSGPVSAAPGYYISLDDEAVTIAPGETEILTVSIERFGSFTVDGAGFTDPITLSAPQLPAGVTATFLPSVLGPTQDESVLVLTAADNATGGSQTISVSATTDVGMDRSGNVLVRVPLSNTGGPYSLVCDSITTPLPEGFHCMDNGSGNIAPGLYDHSDLWGWWVDSDIGLCLRLDDDGYSYGRFRAPQVGGGGTTTTGPAQWGIIVRSDGTPEGAETQWYLFVGAGDDQTKLFGYDSASNSIMSWGFVESASCPW